MIKENKVNVDTVEKVTEVKNKPKRNIIFKFNNEPVKDSSKSGIIIRITYNVANA